MSVPSRTARAGLVLVALSCVRDGRSASRTPLPTVDPIESASRPGPIERGSEADAAKLAGVAAPAMPKLRWLDGQARDLQTLRGRVLVVRNFTNECPFCASTIPALQRIHEKYGNRGVTVLGVYHPKPQRHVSSEDVAEFTKSLGVTFPIAVDEDWSLFNRWWKGRSDEGWTSITWVLDRRGTFRYVHSGGEYHDGGGAAHDQCRADLATLVRTLDEILAQPAD